MKGKFITLACSLLETKPNAKKEALDVVKKLTGKEFNVRVGMKLVCFKQYLKLLRIIPLLYLLEQQLN